MPTLPAKNFWIGLFCVLLPVTLQIQTTFFYSYEAYKGLRICLSDLALPFAGFAILWSLLRRKSHWPAWPFPHVYLWLVGFLVILTGALVNTYLSYDVWSFWGLTNKIPGMIVVSAYFCLGGWLATNLQEHHLILFFRSLFGFFIALMLTELGGILWQDFYNYPLAMAAWPDYPLEGFFDNRNVYALMVLVLCGLLFSFMMSGVDLLPRWIGYGVAVLLPYFLIEIGSRAGLITAVVMTIIFAIFYRTKIFRFIGCFIAGVVLIMAVYHSGPQKLLLFHYNQMEIISHIDSISDRSQPINDVANEITYAGDNFRLQVLNISKDMIMDHPVIGSGLGSSFIVQKEIRGTRFDVIENTPVWLWVETGLIGLAAFAAFYFLCVKTLWQRRKADDFYGALSRGMLVAIGCFSVMTCLHELMYTRQIWFLLGLSLALPLAAIKMRQTG